MFHTTCSTSNIEKVCQIFPCKDNLITIHTLPLQNDEDCEIIVIIKTWKKMGSISIPERDSTKFASQHQFECIKKIQMAIEPGVSEWLLLEDVILDGKSRTLVGSFCDRYFVDVEEGFLHKMYPRYKYKQIAVWRGKYLLNMFLQQGRVVRTSAQPQQKIKKLDKMGYELEIEWNEIRHEREFAENEYNHKLFVLNDNWVISYPIVFCWNDATQQFNKILELPNLHPFRVTGCALWGNQIAVHACVNRNSHISNIHLYDMQGNMILQFPCNLRARTLSFWKRRIWSIKDFPAVSPPREPPKSIIVVLNNEGKEEYSVTVPMRCSNSVPWKKWLMMGFSDGPMRMFSCMYLAENVDNIV